MRAPLITEEAVQKLNDDVRSKIDDRLFLCCNYSPTPSYAISEDGWYFTAIQDLYKFAYDTSCIIKNYRNYSLSEEDKAQLRKLGRCLNDIQMLRSVQSHSQNENNGRIEQNRLQEYETWIQKVLKKKEPQTQDDFSVLNQKLENIAKDLLEQLQQFIACVGASPQKADSVKKWIEQTLKWYCNNTKRDIYCGHLQNEYLRRTKRYSAVTNNFNSRDLKGKIVQWMEDAFLAPINNELEKVKTDLKGNVDALNELSQGATLKISEELCATVQQNLEDEQEELEKQKTKLEEELEKKQAELEEEKKDKGGMLNVFFSRLEKELRELIENQADPIGSLLPQDLLQKHIDSHFCDVRLPERDF